MQKIGLKQTLTQKLSPQQIQFIKLLQVPTAELAARIEEELEVNPALEEVKEEIEDNFEDAYEQEETEQDDFQQDEIRKEENDINIEDYLGQEDYAYKMQGDGYDPNAEQKETPIAVTETLQDDLLEQLGLLDLTEKQVIIGRQLIGSIENDGYIRREMEAIVNDLMFRQGISAEVEEVEEVLKIVQQLDPPGIAARSLQECLQLQLERKKETHPEQMTLIDNAIKVITLYFNEFVKKHYDKIQKKLNCTDAELKEIIQLITKLNPKPGASADSTKPQYIIPDYILQNNNGKLELQLNGRNVPQLRISRDFSEMLDTYDKNKKDKKLKEAATFIKQKLDAAQGFIEAIKQRQQTLLKTMQGILAFQHDFFLTGDEGSLKPMILKDIAERIGMDISTVSRVVSSKYIQTEFGVYPLKYFFSEGIATNSGEDVSSREVKQIIKEIIEREDKYKPMSDDAISDILHQKGYNIARRTVAKYREQLNIPVARLRKEL